jgi:hypothetical protein
MMKNMKKIEISPEWILEKLAVTHHADGKGNVTISADSVSDSCWIDLALKTIGVNDRTFCIVYDPDPENQCYEVQWRLKLEAIKAECPNLYKKLKSIDEANAQSLRVEQKLPESTDAKR